MATVIFDFDSTLINCESLEEILKLKGITPEKFQSITNAGMEGKMPFEESLKKRLALAPLSIDDFKTFGVKAINHLTQGMDDLIHSLQKRGVDVWIISGAFREAIYPLAAKLNIPKNQVLALRFEGPYLTKAEQASEVSWSRPAIIIGDGMTDYELVEKGFADRFIIFTQHVKRQAVMKKGEEASSVDELKKLLTYV